MEELFALIEKLPNEMLERVQRAVKWRDGAAVVGGAGCLVYHAAGNQEQVDYCLFEDLSGQDCILYWQTFDDLSFDYGAGVVGRECSAKAAEILAARRVAKRAAVEA
jgi:hypothetical protein